MHRSFKQYSVVNILKAIYFECFEADTIRLVIANTILDKHCFANEVASFSKRFRSKIHKRVLRDTERESILDCLPIEWFRDDYENHGGRSVLCSTNGADIINSFVRMSLLFKGAKISVCQNSEIYLRISWKFYVPNNTVIVFTENAITRFWNSLVEFPAKQFYCNISFYLIALGLLRETYSTRNKQQFSEEKHLTTKIAYDSLPNFFLLHLCLIRYFCGKEHIPVKNVTSVDSNGQNWFEKE